MTQIKYLAAPADWDQKSANPFTSDGAYGAEWSAFCLLGASDDRLYNGTGPNGLYSVGVGGKCEGIEARLADFLRYESAHDRTVIVAAPQDVDRLVQRALSDTPEDPHVRAEDPRWAVHSTPLERWAAIEECGELRSLARLQREGLAIAGIGFHELREPADYAEYVMLGSIDGTSAEHVVASHRRGEIFTDEDAPYLPGVRLYFDWHEIIRGGLTVRDGLHLKVHDHLALQPHLVAAIGVRDVDPDRQVSAWTPRTFLEKANAHFKEHIAREGDAGSTTIPAGT